MKKNQIDDRGVGRIRLLLRRTKATSREPLEKGNGSGRKQAGRRAPNCTDEQRREETKNG